MELTERRKARIDNMSYYNLLFQWRFAPAGDPMFQGETGDYWADRMSELRSLPGGEEIHIQASKDMGLGW